MRAPSSLPRCLPPASSQVHLHPLLVANPAGRSGSAGRDQIRVGAYQSRSTRGSSCTSVEEEMAWNAQSRIHWNTGPGLKLPRFFRPHQRPDAFMVPLCLPCLVSPGGSSLIIVDVLGTTAQAGPQAGPAHPPPLTRPSPREHPPSRISPSSSPPIAARLIHFSSQCVRIQPTRQKHPCLPIRYICSGPRNSLKPLYLKPNCHHQPRRAGT